jgi:hypothetical protein
MPPSSPSPSHAAAPSRRAVVARPRACTLCRECLREPAWEPRVLLERVNTHFLFSVESTGAVPAAVLVGEAVKILSKKSRDVLEALDGGAGGAAEEASAAAAAAVSAGAGAGSNNAGAEGGFGGVARAAGSATRGVPLLGANRMAIYSEAIMESHDE